MLYTLYLTQVEPLTDTQQLFADFPTCLWSHLSLLFLLSMGYFLYHSLDYQLFFFNMGKQTRVRIVVFLIQSLTCG